MTPEESPTWVEVVIVALAATFGIGLFALAIWLSY